MDASLTSGWWHAAVEIPIHPHEISDQEYWSADMFRDFIVKNSIGDDVVPREMAASEHAGTELKHSSQGAMSFMWTVSETFGSLEPPHSIRSEPEWPFGRIISFFSDEATHPKGGNYDGYALYNGDYATLVLGRRIREFRNAVNDLFREPGSKSLLLVMEEARTAVRLAYHLCSRHVKERFDMAFTPRFGLPCRRMKFSLMKQGIGKSFGYIRKHFRALEYLENQMLYFSRNLSENNFWSLKSMAQYSGLVETALGSSPWTHKVVNGPEHHSVPDQGAGIGVAISKEENCRNAGTWLVATAAPHHATGNRELLTGFMPDEDIFLQAGDGAPMEVRGRGSIVTDAVVLPDVWFVPGLAANLVSAGQLAELGYTVGFARGMCRIIDGGGSLAGEARVGEDGLFELHFLKLPLAM